MTPWDTFFRDTILSITKKHTRIIDIGGGLRISREKSNRLDPSRLWIWEHLTHHEYLVMDPVPDFHPDIVGDIHRLPFPDQTEEAILCLAILEHVENPHQAVKEMFRVLMHGGSVFLYVPFLFYYHAEPGYYKDYWRFTKDTLEYLFKDFSKVDIMPVRGALETWVHLSPLGKISLMKYLARWLDRVTGKIASKQVSGYYLYATK